MRWTNGNTHWIDSFALTPRDGRLTRGRATKLFGECRRVTSKPPNSPTPAPPGSILSSDAIVLVSVFPARPPKVARRLEFADGNRNGLRGMPSRNYARRTPRRRRLRPAGGDFSARAPLLRRRNTRSLGVPFVRPRRSRSRAFRKMPRGNVRIPRRRPPRVPGFGVRFYGAAVVEW